MSMNDRSYFHAWAAPIRSSRTSTMGKECLSRLRRVLMVARLVNGSFLSRNSKKISETVQHSSMEGLSICSNARRHKNARSCWVFDVPHSLTLMY